MLFNVLTEKIIESIKTDISNIKTNISSILSEIESIWSGLNEASKKAIEIRYVFTGTVNINGNSGVSKTYTPPVIDGYKPIGVTGWYLTGTHASGVTLPNVYLPADEKLYVYFKNTDSVSVSLTNDSYFSVMYQKR